MADKDEEAWVCEEREMYRLLLSELTPGWGEPPPADDGTTKFWDKKESDRRPRKGEQVGGSATGHIAKDGDAWGKKEQYYKDDDGNWQSYVREGPLSELF